MLRCATSYIPKRVRSLTSYEKFGILVAAAAPVAGAEYPPADATELTADDGRDDIPNARAVVDLCERVLDLMSPF
jgi:hypothetical protein